MGLQLAPSFFDSSNAISIYDIFYGVKTADLLYLLTTCL
jgi:hypothetical protein